MVIPEIAVLVEPHRQSEGPEAALLVERDLSGFEFGLVAVGNAGQSPDAPIGCEPAVIQPEDGPGFRKLPGLEEKARVDDGDEFSASSSEEDLRGRRYGAGRTPSVPSRSESGPDAVYELPAR